MDWRYYEILRDSDRKEFEAAINDPEDELYGIVWGLFERLVIDPAEIISSNFCGQNQFRYHIDTRTLLEFVPDPAYFAKRIGADQQEACPGPAGVHLQFLILPSFTCLFSARLAIWGAPEHRALKTLWRKHRAQISSLLRRVKPMICVSPALTQVRHAENLDQLLDLYFSTQDEDYRLEFQYPFAHVEDMDDAQNFMIAMGALYQSVRHYSEERTDTLAENLATLREFYFGHAPHIPAPLPGVDLSVGTDVS